MEPLVLTAIFAIIISIVSLIPTIVFSYLQMEHNKNSVRPLCEIILTNYENKIAVKIFNFGTGPMIITNCICKDTENNRHDELLRELMPKIGRLWTTSTHYVNGRTVPVGGKITLILLAPIKGQNSIDADIKERVRRALSTITIDVAYTDIYGCKRYEKIRDREGSKLSTADKIKDCIDRKCCAQFKAQKNLEFFGKPRENNENLTADKKLTDNVKCMD